MSSARSAALFASGPAWSSEDANATSPYRETVPYVGLRPQMPESAAGCRIDPPVSGPVAAGTMRAAPAAAEPPEEPPGTRLLAHGFLTGPKCELSLEEPMANSSMLHLPSI